MRPTSRFSFSLTLAAGLLSAGLLAACGTDESPASRPLPILGVSDQPADMSTSLMIGDFSTVSVLTSFDSFSGEGDLGAALGDFNSAAITGTSKISLPSLGSCPGISVSDNVLGILTLQVPDPLVVWGEFGATACDTGGGWVSGTIISSLYGLSSVFTPTEMLNAVTSGGMTLGDMSSATLVLALDFYDLTRYPSDPSGGGVTGDRLDGGLDFTVNVDAGGNPANGTIATDVYIRLEQYTDAVSSGTVIISNMSIDIDPTTGALDGGLRYATPADGFVDITLTGLTRDSGLCASGEPTSGTITFGDGVHVVAVTFDAPTVPCGDALVSVDGGAATQVTVGTL